jgi:hypothetical protein
MSGEPSGIAVTVDAPIEVPQGKTFDLVVTVQNDRKGKSFKIGDLDIYGDYLRGFVVLSKDPEPESEMGLPLDDGMSHTYNVWLTAGETREFTFSLRAEEPGIYRGDVDVYEGMRCITKTAQTVVKEGE